MSRKFKIGDSVECISDLYESSPKLQEVLVRNRFYTVKSISKYGKLTLLLFNEIEHIGFNHIFFKLHKSKEQLEKDKVDLWDSAAK